MATLAQWNESLLKFFFSSEKSDHEVFVTVTRGFLAERGRRDFGIENGDADFISSVCRGNKNPCEKADFYLGQFTENLVQIPGYFAHMCLFVLAWGEDVEDYNANAYYVRLNSILREGGNTGPEITTVHFPVVVELWRSLSEWTRQPRGIQWGGRFEARTFGVNSRYVGYPLSQALITAGERKRLETVFLAALSDYEAEMIRAEILLPILLQYHSRLSERARRTLNAPATRPAFLQLACSLFGEWQRRPVSETDIDDPIDIRISILISIRYNLLQTPVWHARLRFRNGDCPIDPIHVSLFNAQGNQLGVARLVSRHSAEWSAPIQIGNEWLDEGLQVRLKINELASIELIPSCTNRAVIPFEHEPSLGDWIQRPAVTPNIKCRILSNRSADATRFLECNEGLSTRQVFLNPRWTLHNFDEGVRDSGAFGVRDSIASISLIGGIKLGGNHARYSVHGPPNLRISGPPEHTLKVSSANDSKSFQNLPLNVVHNLWEKGELGDGQYSLALMSPDSDAPIATKSFTIQSLASATITLQLPSSGWPEPVEENSFLFSTEHFSISMEAGQQVGRSRLITRTELPAEFTASHNFGAIEFFLCPRFPGSDLLAIARNQQGRWFLPHGLSDGNYGLSAKWMGMEVGKVFSLKIGNLPQVRIRVAGAAPVFSETEETPAIFGIRDHDQLALSVDSDMAVSSIVYSDGQKRISGAGRLQTFHIRPEWVVHQAPIEIKSFFGSVEIANYSLFLKPVPSITIAMSGGEQWPNTEIYRGDRLPFIEVDVHDTPVEELTVFVGGKKCFLDTDRFVVPEPIANGIHYITVFWGGMQLENNTNASLCVEAAPEFRIAIQGGPAGPSGFFKNALPTISVSGWNDSAFRSFMSVLLIGGGHNLRCEISCDGRVKMPRIDTGDYIAKIFWRGVDIGASASFVVVTQPVVKLNLLGGVFREYNSVKYYSLGELPVVAVQTSAPEFKLKCGGQHLKSEDNIIFDVDPSTASDGKININYGDDFGGKVSLNLNVFDSSWKAIGPSQGNRAPYHTKAGDHPCWFLKKFGKNRRLVLGPDCPEVECSACQYSRGGGASDAEGCCVDLPKPRELDVSHEPQLNRFLNFVRQGARR